jgi:hypothetical protein
MTRNHVLAIVIAVICTVLPFAGQFYGDRASGALMIDFRAYYCAASASAKHENPYFAESLHPCESAPVTPFYHAPPSVTVPAPYPPYVLLLLYPLTLLPFGLAASIWWAILALALFVAAYALARVTRQPFVVAWAVLVLSVGLTSLTNGNILPVSVAALMVAALCAQLGYLPVAALAIAVAMIEPQIALPAAVAAFVRFPRIRLVLASFSALLGLASLVTSGLLQNLAYITTVLPAHALSEVSRDNQYSLSTVVSALGVSDAHAAAIGSISFIIAGIIGIVVGIRLARDYHDPAFALVVPPAFSVFGGSYVHTGVIAIAAPACLLLFVRAEKHRRLLLTALVLLAVPWIFATSAASFLAPLFPVAVLVYVLGGRDRTLALGAAVLSLAVIATLFVVALHPSTHLLSQSVTRPFIDPRLPEASWRELALGNSTNRLATWLLRLPTWIGLIAFVAASLAAVRHRTLAEAI